MQDNPADYGMDGGEMDDFAIESSPAVKDGDSEVRIL